MLTPSKSIVAPDDTVVAPAVLPSAFACTTFSVPADTVVAPL